MINKILVAQRLEMIDGWLKKLKELSCLSHEEFSPYNWFKGRNDHEK